jgi:catechol 2,3-dioxygenase-like lactoylglutathione lyase family enzyme
MDDLLVRGIGELGLIRPISPSGAIPTRFPPKFGHSCGHNHRAGMPPTMRQTTPMGISGLDHFFVRANDLEVTKAWYCDVLGFEEMPRPAFPFPGYWLGVGGAVQVHMGPHGVDGYERFYVGTTAESATDHTGVVDHIALVANDPSAMARRFTELGVHAEHRWIPSFGIAQLFLRDPNGVAIELNFHGLDAEPSW